MLDRIFRDILIADGKLMDDPGDPQLFTSICARLGVSNVAYMGINLPKKTNRDFFVHNTYSKEWALKYETENFVAVDPVLRLGLTSIMPIDWGELGKLSKLQREFFEVSEEYKIGQQGLSFPLRGLYNETAVFSVTADFSPKEWQNFKRERLKELRVIADLIHQDVVGDSFPQDNFDRDLLTSRESECLRWCAEGKTYQDISDLMGITPRTVRFFLEGARHKLSCLNATHTVAVALHKGLI
jgi:DNA-binding CsgD family transcriptional regulator